MSTKTKDQQIPEPQQERSRRTHRAILQATEELMGARPFDQISVAEIAAAAGVSVGNFYNRFPDKTALLLTMFDDYERERTEYLTEAFDPVHWKDMPLEARVDKVVKLMVDFFWSRRALIRSFVMFHRADVEGAAPAIKGRIRTISKAGATVLAEVMKGKDAQSRAELGLQTVNALCREFILFGNDPSKSPMKLTRAAITDHLTRVLLACVN